MDAALNPAALRWLYKCARLPKGARVLVTGGTGSLGRYTCAALCELGASLILPVRDAAKGAALRASLLAEYPDASVTLEYVDMAKPAAVDALAARLIADGGRIDCLVNNAGVFSRAGIRLENGAELHEQVNAFSPLRLTEALLPLLGRSDAPKVVTVTSLAAWNAERADVDPLTIRSATAAYSRSKLMLTRGMVALGRRETDIPFVFSHPGISATDLFNAGAHPSAYAAALMRALLPLMRRVFMSPQKAALSTVYAVCAADKSLDMSAPRGLMQVWGYPKLTRLWRRVTR